ncbi:caspase-1-A-like [Hoplias malabaricus]|uniref:caspase-1-A-like n=1 Tax=Hoplias malabaricus TaxID=27720 RepID=UPI003461A931
MAARLMSVRVELIEGLSQGLLDDLIDGLRASNPPVLSPREANNIRQAHHVQEDRVGVLVDMVCNKGDVASLKLISILEQKDKHLAEKLDLATEAQDMRNLDPESRKAVELQQLR